MPVLYLKYNYYLDLNKHRNYKKAAMHTIYCRVLIRRPTRFLKPARSCQHAALCPGSGKQCHSICICGQHFTHIVKIDPEVLKGLIKFFHKTITKHFFIGKPFFKIKLLESQ